MPDELDGLTDDQKREYREWETHYGPLAKKLSTAYIGHRLQVTYQTAEKRYVKDRIGTYWLILAELIEISIHNQDYQLFIIDFLKALRADGKARR